MIAPSLVGTAVENPGNPGASPSPTGSVAPSADGARAFRAQAAECHTRPLRCWNDAYPHLHTAY